MTMNNMIKKLYEQYKDVIPYLFFGVCTTVVNIVVYWVFAHVLGTGVMPATIAAWVLAVLFAYVTNRKWVFHSAASGREEITKEIVSFFSCRLGTGVVDWLMMFVLVSCLHLPDLLIKILANIIVIVLNYVLSKFVIFKQQS